MTDQIIHLDNPDDPAVFTEDGEVYYNLTRLIVDSGMTILPHCAAADAAGDPVEIARMQGAVQMLEMITDGMLGIKARREGEAAMSSVETLADMFPNL
jgi:hypothetical protein